MNCSTVIGGLLGFIRFIVTIMRLFKYSIHVVSSTIQSRIFKSCRISSVIDFMLISFMVFKYCDVVFET